MTSHKTAAKETTKIGNLKEMLPSIVLGVRNETGKATNEAHRRVFIPLTHCAKISKKGMYCQATVQRCPEIQVAHAQFWRIAFTLWRCCGTMV